MPVEHKVGLKSTSISSHDCMHVYMSVCVSVCLNVCLCVCMYAHKIFKFFISPSDHVKSKSVAVRYIFMCMYVPV